MKPCIRAFVPDKLVKGFFISHSKSFFRIKNAVLTGKHQGSTVFQMEHFFDLAVFQGKGLLSFRHVDGSFVKGDHTFRPFSLVERTVRFQQLPDHHHAEGHHGNPAAGPSWEERPEAPPE